MMPLVFPKPMPVRKLDTAKLGDALDIGIAGFLSHLARRSIPRPLAVMEVAFRERVEPVVGKVHHGDPSRFGVVEHAAGGAMIAGNEHTGDEDTRYEDTKR